MQMFANASFEKEKPASTSLSINKGKGQRLRDIDNVEHRIALTRTTAPPLILLHRILFPSHKGHPTKTTIKGHIRDFSGWTGDEEDEARKRMEKREAKELKAICELLDVGVTGSKKELIDHIVAFCQKPAPSGHAFRSKKSKGKKSGGSGKKGKGKGKKRGGGMNAYLVFVKEKRDKGEAEGMGVAEFGKKMGEEWRGLDDDEKEAYKTKAQELKAEGEEGEGGDGSDDEEEDGTEDEEEEDKGEDEEEGEEGEGKEATDGGETEKKKGKKKQADDDEEGDEEEVSEEHRSVLERLRGSIASILKGADLNALTVKKVKEALTVEHGEEIIAQFAKNIKAIVTKAVQGSTAEDGSS